jgi:hypothetical protein
VTTLILAILSTIVAVLSCAISYGAVQISRAQARLAADANDQARQVGLGEAVIYFSGRYFDLMSRGPGFDDPRWAHEFWSLQATQFYFFDMGWLPELIYQLWMVELATTYRRPGVWTLHEEYLRCYSSNYPVMCDFFARIQELASGSGNEAESLRSRAVQSYVKIWYETERVPVSR